MQNRKIVGRAVCFHSGKFFKNVQIKDLSNNILVTTDDKGEFSLEWHEDVPLTLTLEYNDYQTTQTPTFKKNNFNKTPYNITFQVPHKNIFTVFSLAMCRRPKPKYCQIAGTVTAFNKSLDDLPHGEPSVTVELLSKDYKKTQIKPYYCGIFKPGLSTKILSALYGSDLTYKTNPMESGLNATSQDGGVIFTNVPAGDYIVRATKPGVSFTDFHVLARPGMFINISPPVLQADKKTEEASSQAKNSDYSFIKPVLVLGFGLFGFATCGVGTAVISAITTYATAETVESISGSCRRKL